jgi:chromosome segregation ATPase
MCGGYINTLLGDALTVNGIELLPLITLGATVLVGILSNGYTKEQKEKIKALFSKSTTNELVKEEIKKTIKEKSAQLAQFNKILTTKQHELDNLNTELATLNNTLEAKKEMYSMPVQLATAEDVQLANNAVTDCQAKIVDKTNELNETQKTIDNLNTQINALKSQL